MKSSWRTNSDIIIRKTTSSSFSWQTIYLTKPSRIIQFQRERGSRRLGIKPRQSSPLPTRSIIKCPGPCSSRRRDPTRDLKSNPPSRSQPVYWQSYIPAEAVPRAGGKLRVAKETRRRSITLSRITLCPPPHHWLQELFARSTSRGRQRRNAWDVKWRNRKHVSRTQKWPPSALWGGSGKMTRGESVAYIYNSLRLHLVYRSKTR